MNLSDIASIATVISSLAVLVSLVYLSLQIRQTERNQRAMMDQGAGTRNVEINMFLADPRIISLTTRVSSGDRDFTAEEISLLHIRLRTSLLTGQDIFVQHKSGFVDQVTFDTAHAVLRFVLAEPVYRALWLGTRLSYAEEWRTYIDRLIASVPLAHGGNPVGRFKKDLDSVLAANAPSGAHGHAAESDEH